MACLTTLPCVTDAGHPSSIVADQVRQILLGKAVWYSILGHPQETASQKT